MQVDRKGKQDEEKSSPTYLSVFFNAGGQLLDGGAENIF